MIFFEEADFSFGLTSIIFPPPDSNKNKIEEPQSEAYCRAKPIENFRQSGVWLSLARKDHEEYMKERKDLQKRREAYQKRKKEARERWCQEKNE